MPGTNVTLAGNSFQTANIVTANIEHEDMPDQEMAAYSMPHANRSKIPYRNFSGKTIKISGKLIASSITALDTLTDTFKSYLLGIDQNLDIDYNGTTRRYVATVNATSFDRPGNLLHTNFSIEFICTDPFGRNISPTTAISATARTLSSYTDSHTFLGTAPFQLVTTTITLTSVTGGTGGYIQWGNGGNGQGIQITRNFVSGDIIVINCYTLSVKVNGIEVAFTGAFPEFPPGPQTMQYSDSFTTRSFSIDSSYNPGYL